MPVCLQPTHSMSEWFETQQIEDDLYLTTEPHFYQGNRCNIWLLKGPTKDVIIDTGLGVRNLREHLEKKGLIDPEGAGRECLVVCTHVHFDHTGGAHHFKNVYIHEDDLPGLQSAAQLETLNYVKSQHFMCQPYPEFSAFHYKVPQTECQPLKDGDLIDIGDGQNVEIIHVPGHTKGNIIIHYAKRGYLFSGDFAYQCSHGSDFLDWLPHSSIPLYVESCRRILDWMQRTDIFVSKIYPGHFSILARERLETLLMEYLEGRADAGCVQCTTGCLKVGLVCWIGSGCFRCCPC